MKFDAHYRELIRLATSVVIYNKPVMKKMEEAVVMDSGHHAASPADFRYHLHLNGRKHFLDEPIYFTSLLNNSKLELNVNNLHGDDYTLSKIREFGTEYRKLVIENPVQSNYVRGLLDPVDMDTILKAKDGQLLAASRHYIEPQEVSLLRDIQEWIYIYLNRWDVGTYNKIESHFTAMRYAILYAILPLAIHNYRLEKVMTDEVHSFYLKSYVTNSTMFGDLVESLSYDQLKYIRRHYNRMIRGAGTEAQFNELVKGLFEVSGYPLDRVTIKKKIAWEDERVRNELSLHREPLNDIGSREGVRRLPLKDKIDARFDGINYKQVELNHRFSTSPIAKEYTRILESRVTSNKPYNDDIASYAVRHWLMLALEGRLIDNQYVAVPGHHRKISMMPNEAAYLVIYLIYLSLGNPTTDINGFTIPNVRFNNYPDVNQLMDAAEYKHVTALDLEVFMRGGLVFPDRMNKDTFKYMMFESYKLGLKKTMMLSAAMGGGERSELEHAMNACYNTYEYTASHTNPYDYLTGIGIDFSKLSPADYSLLINNIFDEFIGLKDYLVEKDSSLPQKASIEILKRLMPYDALILSNSASSYKCQVTCPGMRLDLAKLEVFDDQPWGTLRAATVRETLEGRIDFAYVSPYTLRIALEIAETNFQTMIKSIIDGASFRFNLEHL